MLALLFAVAAFILTVISVFSFVAWALHEHGIANQYRALAAEYQKAVKDQPIKPLQSGWQVVYKIGKGTKTAQVAGATEGEALLNFTKSGNTRYDSIISITR